MNVKIYHREVEGFIENLEKPTGAKLVRTISLLELFGPLLGMPHTKKITSTIYELRVRGQQEVRVLYAFHRNTAILLHGFIKKSDKIPAKELETAKNRLSQLTGI